MVVVSDRAAGGVKDSIAAAKPWQWVGTDMVGVEGGGGFVAEEPPAARWWLHKSSPSNPWRPVYSLVRECHLAAEARPHGPARFLRRSMIAAALAVTMT